MPLALGCVTKWNAFIEKTNRLFSGEKVVTSLLGEEVSHDSLVGCPERKKRSYMIEHVTFCTTKGIGLLLSVTKLANRCWVLPVTVCQIKLIHLL